MRVCVCVCVCLSYGLCMCGTTYNDSKHLPSLKIHHLVWHLLHLNLLQYFTVKHNVVRTQTHRDRERHSLALAFTLTVPLSICFSLFNSYSLLLSGWCYLSIPRVPKIQTYLLPFCTVIRVALCVIVFSLVFCH